MNMKIQCLLGAALEHFHKCCSDVEAVFLSLGFVSARSQAAGGMLPRRNFAQRPKILAPHRYIISVNALITGFVAIASAAPHDVPPESRESIEWCDIWISHANETNLPRVLLIGDSITRAYYPEVEKKLAGKAYVARLATSRFASDPVLAKEIALVLDGTKFDIIHFNNGMHGWQHSEAEYRKAFPEFLATIRSHAPKAKLIWASTTTLKESKVLAPDALGQASDERIAARNDIALQCIKAKEIPVDDLFALSRGHPEYHSDNVHFNDQGILLQAGQVAGSIEKLLSH